MLEEEIEKLISEYLFEDLSPERKLLLSKIIEEDVYLKEEVEHLMKIIVFVKDGFDNQEQEFESSIMSKIASQTYEKRSEFVLSQFYQKLLDRNPYFTEFVFLLSVIIVSIIEVGSLTSSYTMSSFTNDSYLINTCIAFYIFTLIRRIYKDAKLAAKLNSFEEVALSETKINSQLLLFKMMFFLVFLILAIQL
jgi:hypothetical protein